MPERDQPDLNRVRDAMRERDRHSPAEDEQQPRRQRDDDAEEASEDDDED
jgi:hypothetical protein